MPFYFLILYAIYFDKIHFVQEWLVPERLRDIGPDVFEWWFGMAMSSWMIKKFDTLLMYIGQIKWQSEMELSSKGIELECIVQDMRISR